MKVLLIAFTLLIWGAPIEAAIKYVDKQLTSDCTANNYSVANRNCTGSDGNAWNTIKKGIDNLAASDTLLIRGGIYDEIFCNSTDTKLCVIAGHRINIPRGKSWAAPTKIAAFSSGGVYETVLIRPTGSDEQGFLYSGANLDQYVWLDGLIFDGGQMPGDIILFRLGYGSWGNSGIRKLRITNSTFRNGRCGAFITGAGSTDGVVELEFLNNVVHSNGRTAYDHAFYLDHTSDSIIAGNVIYDNAGFAFKLHSGWNNRNKIQSNIIRNNNGGITLGYGAADNLIDRNLIYDNQRASSVGNLCGQQKDEEMAVVGRNGLNIPVATRTLIYHNVVFNNGCIANCSPNGSINKHLNGIHIAESVDTVVMNNISLQNTGRQIVNDSSPTTVSMSNLTTGSAGFIDKAARDFRLSPDSSAIGAGTPISGYIYSGAPDIGAYEFQTTQPTRVPSAPVNLQIR